LISLGVNRAAGEVEELPMELKTPLAIANHLLDTTALVVPKTAAQDVKEKDANTASSDSSPAASDNVRFQLNIITGQY
jgi:hypothetical protein